MKNKAQALASITRRVKDGNDVFEVYLGVDLTGKQVRFSRHTSAELRAAIDEYYSLYRTAGPIASQLTARQITDARLALDALEQGGYEAVTLLDIAKDYIARTPAPNVRIKLGAALDAYLATFDAGAQTLHINAVRSRVGRWVDWCGRDTPLAQVARGHLERYLSGQSLSAKTYNNILSYCKTFLNWCCTDAIGLKENPFAGIPSKRILYTEPEFVSVEAMEAVALAVEEAGDKYAMAYLALSPFSGVRMEELGRIREAAERDVNTADEAVRVSRPKGWTKGILPRMVQLLPNAAAWLAAAGGAETVAKTDFAAARARVADMARSRGFAWPKNAGRHSFITYHVAAFGEPAKTEAMAGTSAAMRVQHYMGLATRAQGERYFAIMPHGAA